MTQRSSKRTLENPPSTLSLYGRAVLGSVPLAGKLPFLAGGGGEVPEVELVLEDVKIDTSRLAEYCGVCGFTLRDTLPATYPHTLAFPLHMALMTHPDFPFGAIGLVHVQNRIEQRRPIAVGESLEVRVSSGKLQPHPKGRTFTLHTTVLAGGEPVWESESTNLRRGKGDGSQKSSKDAEPELRAEAEWRLAGDLGRRYGAVSGDRNPIHMYGLTAKAFGFPSQIAHGMWTKARCVAALESRLPDAFAVEVSFKRPILLPSTVVFATAAGRDDATALGVSAKRDGVPHLTGSVGGLRPA